MPLDTAAGLVDALRRCRLLEPGRLDEAVGLQAAFPEPRALAGELIRRSWLTPYQANQLLQGKGAGLLLGSYVLLERVGEGGMGAVFKARNWKLGRVVAVKVVRKERLENPDAVRRFQREIRAAAQLDHPNIVRAIDADEAGGAHFFVMEYVEGMDLARLVKADGPLPFDRACDYCRQAALGLQHASERGLVHRDVKPQNLLLAPGGVVKILDMGLARLSHGDDGESTSLVTHEGAVMGTPDFMAPEQTLDSHSVDIRADLYSLGCTLYFLLTGKVPFPGGSLGEKIARHQMREPQPVEQLRPGTTPGVTAVLRKLMAKRPEDRYQTPAEAALALAAAASAPVLPAVTPGGTPQAAEATAAGWSSIVAPPDTQTPAATPPIRRRRAAPSLSPRLLLGSAGVVLLIVLGLAGLLWLLPRPPHPAPQPPVTRAGRNAPGPAAAEDFERWVRDTADLPPDRQAQEVADALKRRNPGFDGPVQSGVESGAVTELAFATDHVTDLAPLRALAGLRSLDCQGSEPGAGRLEDLRPLKGLKLTHLVCAKNPLSDLGPLRDMPLTHLDCGDTKAIDLSPLQGMPLMFLACPHTPVADLAPLRDAPLFFLRCDDTRVTDLTPLTKTPLRQIAFDFHSWPDAEPLRAVLTLEQINGRPAAEFWKDVDARRPR